MSHSYWTQDKIDTARPRELEVDDEEGWSWRSNSIGESTNAATTTDSPIPDRKEQPTRRPLETSASTLRIQSLADDFLNGISLDGASTVVDVEHHYWTAEKIHTATHRETAEIDESVCSWKACDLQDDGTPVLCADASPLDDDPILKDTTQHPLKLVGLLLFTNSGTAYSGTAFLVDKSTILTAGHNIFLKGDPRHSENIVWIPGYSFVSPTQKPFGIFDCVPEKVYTSPKWDGDSANSSPFDYALIHLKPNEKGQTPFDVLGDLLTIQEAQPENSTEFTQVGFYKTSPLLTNTGKYVGLLDGPKGTLTVKYVHPTFFSSFSRTLR
eukprot:TRINITY_DN1679_c0_g3_i2.p1 TRINITY_DN1679_c0_g3~~TRINITY_DN1679_c0_g3_i2.p1  ORF type:complete len:326 (+),score=54.71 TRINITY_DN1679_c0_g3_i2:404-1381(+)